jgi:hypothetical protein
MNLLVEDDRLFPQGSLGIDDGNRALWLRRSASASIQMPIRITGLNISSAWDVMRVSYPQNIVRSSGSERWFQTTIAEENLHERILYTDRHCVVAPTRDK